MSLVLLALVLLQCAVSLKMRVTPARDNMLSRHPSATARTLSASLADGRDGSRLEEADYARTDTSVRTIAIQPPRLRTGVAVPLSTDCSDPEVVAALLWYNEQHETQLGCSGVASFTQQKNGGNTFTMCLAVDSGQSIKIAMYENPDGTREFQDLMKEEITDCADIIHEDDMDESLESEDTQGAAAAAAAPAGAAASHLEMSSKASYLYLDPHHDAFDIREEFPDCRPVFEKWINQGKCGSCAALATVWALRAHHCMQMHGKEPEKLQKLIDLELDIGSLMACGATTAAELPLGSPGIPYLSTICEGGFEQDYMEYAVRFGFDLVRSDTYAPFRNSKSLVTWGKFKFKKPHATRKTTLRCASQVRGQEITLHKRHFVYLHDTSAHYAQCLPREQQKGYTHVESMSLQGLSASFKCSQKPHSEMNLNARGFNYVIPAIEEIKFAIRHGPVIVAIEWFTSFNENREKYSLPDTSKHKRNLYKSDDVKTMTRKQRNRCKHSKHCDYSQGLHVVAFIGYTSTHWIVQNSYTGFGSSTSVGLIDMKESKHYIREAIVPILHDQDDCSGVMVRYVVDGKPVSILEGIEPIKPGFVSRMNMCLFNNPNKNYRSTVIYVQQFKTGVSTPLDIDPKTHNAASSEHMCCPIGVTFQSIELGIDRRDEADALAEELRAMFLE